MRTHASLATFCGLVGCASPMSQYADASGDASVANDVATDVANDVATDVAVTNDATPLDTSNGATDGSSADADMREAGTHAIVLPPAHGWLDYQLGGAYPPPTGVAIVSRDRTAPPASGIYDICYVNGFQIQPGDEAAWMRDHPSLVLRDASGQPVIDATWNEILIDVSTTARRAELVTVIAAWIDGCARAGFEAVEIDNLDSYTRSMGLLTADNAVATIRLFADRAHADGLAIAQKNTSELVPRRTEMGTDFVVAEECSRYRECDAYRAGYGEQVLMIEYDRASFDAGCAAYPSYPIVLRDRNLVPAGRAGYVFSHC